MKYHSGCAHQNQPKRSGFTLLIVVTMLALFAVVGVGFVFYAQSEATASRYARQSQVIVQPEVDPELLLSYFLGQLLYGPGDDATGVQSAMRGHDLAHNTFGYDPTQPNIHPYNGSGRLHFPPDRPILGGDDYPLINYTWFEQDGFVRDPGRIKTRIAPDEPPHPYVIGLNPSYTYPDLNNAFLAVINAKGEIIRQSFVRPETGFGPLDPSNKNWYDKSDPKLKYMVLRPRPADMGPGFPPPADGGGDVRNLPNAKGVPILDAAGNPTGKYYNNDSIWMDLGHPVMIGPDGRKFKPLFAPLIVDLDGKINVTVHGNINYHTFATQNGATVHKSHQGWGTWAVNLGKVLDQGNGNPTEWVNLLRGNGSVPGRYGPDQQPNKKDSKSKPNLPPHFYARVDFDGDGPADSAYRVPGEAPYLPFLTWAFFPQARYGDNNTQEATNHPSLFDPFNPGGDDQPFGYGNLEPILRYGDTNSPAHLCRLFDLIPNNLRSSQVRWSITTHSIDLRVPGMMPYLTGPDKDYTLQTTTKQNLGILDRYGIGPRVKSPPISPLVPQLPPADGEFAATYSDPKYGGALTGAYRSAVAALSRINVNRSLRTVPVGQPNLNGLPLPVTSDGSNDPTKARINLTADPKNLDRRRYLAGKAKREQLAKEIFDRLAWVAAGRRPGDPFPPPKSSQYQALRWLAQIAVNIVDYRDEDDYITVFRWKRDPVNPDLDEIVYGTELPRIVINEVYAEADVPGLGIGPPGGGPLPPGLGGEVKFWIELHNPFLTNKTLSDNGGARLYVLPDGGFGPGIGDDFAPYQVVILEKKAPKAKPLPIFGLRAEDNVDGDYNRADVNYIPRLIVDKQGWSAAKPSANDFDPYLVLPVDQAKVKKYQEGENGKNQGFFVIGPPGNFPQNEIEPTLRIPTQPRPGPVKGGLSYKIPPGRLAMYKKGGMAPTHAVLLRRLACPHLPHDPNKTIADPNNPGRRIPNPLYNPYITVDYMEEVAANVLADPNAVPGNGNRRRRGWSYGRKQPFAAHFTQVVRQQRNPQQNNAVQHTFFKQNNPLTQPFDWLVHLDRELISVMELLHVSAYHPHELTQQFVVGNDAHKHRIDWFDEQKRVYRLFELLETANRMGNLKNSYRVPGRINLNSIWDEKTFQALCDAQNVRFKSGEVSKIFQRLMELRAPKKGGSGADLYFANPENHHPFRGLAMGAYPPDDPQFPNGGIRDTFLRTFTGDAKPQSRRLFAIPPGPGNPPRNVPSAHPYRQAELMTKIFANSTTRSNLFAVWVTVGFFEVVDDTTRPVKLGAEIGRAENRHVRYRMFAIVDRSRLGYVESRLTRTLDPIQPGRIQKIKVLQSWGEIPAAKGNLRAPTGPVKFKIYPGMTLRVGNEIVVVKSVTHSTPGGQGVIEARFEKAHPAGTNVSLVGIRALGNLLLGHPGPQPRFDARKYPDVVPYFNIIERVGSD